MLMSNICVHRNTILEIKRVYSLKICSVYLTIHNFIKILKKKLGQFFYYIEGNKYDLTFCIKYIKKIKIKIVLFPKIDGRLLLN